MNITIRARKGPVYSSTTYINRQKLFHLGKVRINLTLYLDIAPILINSCCDKSVFKLLTGLKLINSVVKLNKLYHTYTSYSNLKLIFNRYSKSSLSVEKSIILIV